MRRISPDGRWLSYVKSGVVIRTSSCVQRLRHRAQRHAFSRESENALARGELVRGGRQAHAAMLVNVDTLHVGP